MSVLMALLLPLGAAAATPVSAAETASAVTARTTTFKTSAFQRLKRAAQPAPSPVLSAPTYADRVLALTNVERTARGVPALALSPCADGYADSWATRLSQLGGLAHQALGPILSTCGARRVGENVAYGNVTPEQLVGLWMGSDGHRANLLNAAYTHLGVGAVGTASGRVYGVQVFVAL